MQIRQSIVLDFLIPSPPPHYGMAGLKVSILGPQIGKIWRFSPSHFYVARMITHIGDKIFQDTPRRVAKFAQIGPGTSKNLWWGKR